MNKRAWTCMLLSILSVLCGCTFVTAANVTSPMRDATIDGGDRTILLSGYPVDTVPLYKCQKVTECCFIQNELLDSYVSSLNDEYVVTYESDTTCADVLFYYNGLMNQAEYATENSAGGMIGERPVVVRVSAEKGQPLCVVIDVGVSEDANPYFADYPGAIHVLGGNANTPSFKAHALFLADKVTQYYSACYMTDLSAGKFSALYEKEYGDKKGFTKSETDYEIRYSFTQGGYVNEVYLNKALSTGDIVTLTIDCRSE